jgi:hypothetical protein
LEAFFGRSLDAVTAADVRGLVSVQAHEDFDLDFKVAHYGRSEAEKRALAVDVAAMANTAGGVILIGVDEDEQARATAAPGVEVSDAERGRISQIVASQVAPYPTFGVEIIYDETDVDRATISPTANDEDGADTAATGFIMITVLRSPSAPHAVLVDKSLRFPKRSGATTRYLSEPEVAAEYANRAAGAARLRDRIAKVEEDAFRRLDRERNAWLVVTLVPELAGDLAITKASFNDFQQSITQTPALIIPAGISLYRVTVGRRRFLADDTGDNSPLARWASLELHTDGAGAYGLRMQEYARPQFALDPDQATDQLIDDEWITLAVLSGLKRLAQHARDLTAASGNGVVRAILLPASASDSLEIGHSRRGLPQSRSQVSIQQDPVVAEAVAPLDSLASPGSDLITVAAALADEIGQAFGIAEMGQLSREGTLRRPYWGPFRQEMVTWAEQHQIDVTDEVLPD